MANLIDGKLISTQIKDELKEEVTELKKKGIEGCLAVSQVGNDPASSESEYCVFAIHIGKSPIPRSVILLSSLSAAGEYVTPSAPYISFATVSIFSLSDRLSS